MKWKVRLRGDESGLDDLVESFDDDPKIFKDDGKYYLWSSKFSDFDEASNVKSQAVEIVRPIRHFGLRDSLPLGDLEIAHVVKINDDGSKDTTIAIEETSLGISSSVSVRETTEGGEEVAPLPADRTKDWTQLALEDNKVAELVQLREQGDDWVNLYRIYEFIQANIEDEANIVEKGWWTESQKDLFKHTANSRDAIGDVARHAQDRIPAPDDPMSHSEAERLVESLIDQWLHHRKDISE